MPSLLSLILYHSLLLSHSCKWCKKKNITYFEDVRVCIVFVFGFDVFKKKFDLKKKNQGEINLEYCKW